MATTIKDIDRRFFTLVSDIDNPKHDKRCKYGTRGVKAFKAGTTVCAIVRAVERDGVVLGEQTYYEVDYHPVPSEAVAAFAAQDPGFDEKPKSLEEVAAREASEPHWIALRAVEALIKSGRLTIDEVIDAYESRHDS